MRAALTQRESSEARPRARPMFLADWTDVLFIHFRVNPDVLTREVPVELDLFDGNAYVSLVAFTQQRLRPRWGGRFTQFLSTPLGEHEFLNVRTYVRFRGERGIYFLVEWIPNRLARVIGPRLYGLPYRLGHLSYEQNEQSGRITGHVQAHGELRFAAHVDDEQVVAEAEGDSLDEFLLERYTAFTCRNDVLRRFRIWHEPWSQVSAHCTLEDRSLLDGASCLAGAELISANYSAGVRDVHIGRPERI